MKLIARKKPTKLSLNGWKDIKPSVRENTYLANLSLANTILLTMLPDLAKYLIGEAVVLADCDSLESVYSSLRCDNPCLLLISMYVTIIVPVVFHTRASSGKNTKRSITSDSTQLVGVTTHVDGWFSGCAFWSDTRKLVEVGISNCSNAAAQRRSGAATMCRAFCIYPVIKVKRFGYMSISMG